ncbi:MAG: hypothetical protein HOV66_19785, partial [Streptomycetaceae bacterium]|nr:hypothetical protein [Streptomycetaceae bacterium]
PIEPRPAPRPVVIEHTDTRPVHEPRPPARPTPRRGWWARLTGANAAAERSWRGRYATHLLEHAAWVAAGRPTEETCQVRYYLPHARIEWASCPPASPAAYEWPPEAADRARAACAAARTTTADPRADHARTTGED